LKIVKSKPQNRLAGNVQLDVTDTLLISGRRENVFIIPTSGQRIEHIPSSIQSISVYGAGGQLHLTAKTIHLTEEGSISASSLGLGERVGTINLQAENLILMEGGQINSSNSLYDVTTGTVFVGVGQGGDINILSKHLKLDTQQPRVNRTGIFSDTYSQGPSGNINVQTDSLDIQRDSAISARAYGPGDAGHINLQAQHLHLSQYGSISTAAIQADGGNIILNGLSGLLYLDNSEITTSVTTGPKGGGNIIIEQPQFTILNKGLIRTQADAGRGGNIHIVADQFLKTPDSLISASSRLGLDGQVIIDSPAETISGSLLVLGTTFTDVSGLLPGFCTALSFEEFINRSRFTFNPIVGSSPRPDDLKPSSLLLPISASPNFTKATGFKANKAELTQRLAWLTGCHR